MKPNLVNTAAGARRDAAIAELKSRLHERFPTAVFTVSEGDDPAGAYLWAAVSVDDPDEVMDLIVDRPIEIQVDEGIPVYVIPMRPFSQPAHELAGIDLVLFGKEEDLYEDL